MPVTINSAAGQGFDEIQQAVRNEDIDRIILHGTFDFGSTSDNRKTVEIPRGVTIQGQGAVIIGGGAVLKLLPPLDEFDDFPKGPADSGPFIVRNQGPEQGGNNKPVIFEGIRFTGWRGEAILVEACRGLEITNCTFVDPVPGTMASEPLQPFTFVHAVLAVGSRCHGHLRAHNNKCFLTGREFTQGPGLGTQPPQTRALASDENFLACVKTRFQSIDISSNTVLSHDDGIEVISNASSTSPGPISISDNYIVLERLIAPNNWGTSCAIVFCNNRGASYQVSRNFISLTGLGTAMALSSDERIKVSHNTLNLQSDDRGACPFGGLMLGVNYGPAALGSLGPSLNHSEILENDFNGQAFYGIWTFDANDDVNPPPPPVPNNDSHDNVIQGNDFVHFRPVITALMLREHTYGNKYNCAQFPGGVIDLGQNVPVPAECPMPGTLPEQQIHI